MRKNLGCIEVLWIWTRHMIVNREALWKVLRMYDEGGKLLNGIKSMHINSLVSVT